MIDINKGIGKEQGKDGTHNRSDVGCSAQTNGFVEGYFIFSELGEKTLKHITFKTSLFFLNIGLLLCLFDFYSHLLEDFIFSISATGLF